MKAVNPEEDQLAWDRGTACRAPIPFAAFSQRIGMITNTQPYGAGQGRTLFKAMGAQYSAPIHHGPASPADELGPCGCAPSDFRIPGAGQPAFLSSANHVMVCIMAPLTAGHLVGNLDAIAVWVADV